MFLGDSITEAWLETAHFHASLGPHVPLNLGIGGDQTQHLLWRIDDGTLEGLSPRLAVVLIGVNNLGNGYEPEETARGIEAVLHEVRRRLLDARVLLLNVLPAGQHPSDELRRAVNATNRLLPRLAEPGCIELLDIGSGLLEADGSIASETMEDFLHPTELGYTTMTRAVAPVVERLLDL